MYAAEFKKFGVHHKSLLWTKAKQDQRFELLLNESYKRSKMSILDFGCGFGDLKKFLSRRSYSLEYEGVDINPAFIKEARRLYPATRFYLASNAADIKKNYQIILCSGTLNTLPGISDKEKDSFVKNTLKKLFRRTEYLLTFNLLSSNTDNKFKKPHNYYASASKILDFISKNLSPRVSIDCASLPFEFTVKVIRPTGISPIHTIYTEQE